MSLDSVPPLELQEEHRDVLIIYAENSPDDKNKARELQEAIEGFSFDSGVTGKVALYDEAIQYGQSYITSLDVALEFSTLLFVIYSKDLEEDAVNWQTSNASLWHTIVNTARGDTFIPVIWNDGVVMPAYARGKRPFDMTKKNWRNLLKRMISRHLGKRLDREKRQEDLRSRHADLSDRATNGTSPNVSQSRHAFVPSQSQNGSTNVHRQESHNNIDIHGIHRNDIDGNGHGAPRFPRNYFNSIINERGTYCLSFLGLVLVSFAITRWKLRQFDT